MVLGPAYVVAGSTYTPADTLNYDAVGAALVGGEGGTAMTVAHHTLPLPSYVEVTSLDSGRTILARVERRGPMAGSELVQLSPGAAAQLGLSGASAAPVRIRRVAPPEAERALLRAGQPVPARMDTPKSLLDVLRRKLGQQNGELTRPAVPPPDPAVAGSPSLPAKLDAPALAAPKPAPVQPAKPAAAAKPVSAKPVANPAPAPARIEGGSLIVQIGAFSSKERASAVAAKLQAQSAASGTLWRVRMGPFRTRAEAEAALAKVRAAGYSDARIQRAN